MKTIQAAIFLAIFLAGLATAVIVPAAGLASATALWSDFLTFQNRVQADPDGVRILNYGGENESENFEALLKKLKDLNNTSPARPFGYAITLLAAAGFILTLRRTTNADKP
jgi:hypothetical protein